MSVVFKGYDNKLKRHVAIKVLHRHLASHAEANARFKREAFAVAKLKHENILDIYDYSDDNNEESFIVTEFIDGQTLREFLDAQSDMLPEIGALICSQICRALAHAHQSGIIHRDIKPDNIMIRRDGVMKLMDFGIAQMLDVTRMTATGQLLGSPAYMSPEHVKGQTIDHRTDIFALGGVLYQMATGVLPFSGSNTHEVLKKIADCEFVAPCHANPKVAKDLSKIITKSLSEAPENRHQSVEALNEELTSFLDESGIQNQKTLCTSYFNSPETCSTQVTEALVPYLTTKGKSQRLESPTKALESFNRVLAIDPENADVKEELDLISNASRRKKTLALALKIAAGGLALACLGFVGSKAYRQSQNTSEPSLSAQTQTNPSLSPIDQTNKPAADLTPLPTQFSSEANEESTAAVAQADSMQEDSKPKTDAPNLDKPVSEKRTPIKAQSKNTPSKKAKNSTLPKDTNDLREKPLPSEKNNTRLVVIPHRGAEYRVGKSPWTPLKSSSTTLTTAQGDVVSARNITCCQEKQISINEKNKGSIRFKLGFLPGSLTPTCDLPDTKVSINGKSSRLGKAATIVINRATGTESVNVNFVNGNSIDTQRLSIKAKEIKDVRCKF